MKIENRIEENDEHSYKIGILNQNSNSGLFRVDPWIYWVFSLPWSSSVEEPQNLCKKRKNRSEKREKNEEQLREKESKDFDPKASTSN